MIIRRVTAYSRPSSRLVSRYHLCQLRYRNLTTEPNDINPTVLSHESPHTRLPESPLIIDFEEQIKQAASKPVKFRHETSSVRAQTQEEPLSKLDVYRLNQASREASNKIGAVLQPHYKPHELITNPPSPRDISLELLLASGAHLGHATALWNPGNQRYIFGIRQGIHLISLDIIASHLRRAAKIVHGVSQNGGLILFVGTRDGQERAVIEAARRTKGYHIIERWVPGTITNKQQLLGGQKLCVLNYLDEEVPLSEKEKKKLVARDTTAQVTATEAEQASTVRAPPSTAAVRPDLVICLNPLENQTMLQECAQYRIPTIGIIDTDCDPTCVTYPIPANDDSLRCVQLIAGILGRAGQDGRLARYETERQRQGDLMKKRERAEEARKREEDKLSRTHLEQEAEEAASEARQQELEQV